MYGLVTFSPTAIMTGQSRVICSSETISATSFLVLSLNELPRQQKFCANKYKVDTTLLTALYGSPYLFIHLVDTKITIDQESTRQETPGGGKPCMIRGFNKIKQKNENFECFFHVSA